MSEHVSRWVSDQVIELTRVLGDRTERGMLTALSWQVREGLTSTCGRLNNWAGLTVLGRTSCQIPDVFVRRGQMHAAPQ